MADEDRDVASNGLVKLVVWVQPDNVSDALEACGRFARRDAEAWRLDAMGALLHEVSVNAGRVLHALASPGHAGKWVPSGQVADELDLNRAQFAGALKGVRAQAEAMSLPSPIRLALKRKDGEPMRQVRLSSEYADLVRQAGSGRAPTVRDPNVAGEISE